MIYFIYNSIKWRLSYVSSDALQYWVQYSNIHYNNYNWVPSLNTYFWLFEKYAILFRMITVNTFFKHLWQQVSTFFFCYSYNHTCLIIIRYLLLKCLMYSGMLFHKVQLLGRFLFCFLMLIIVGTYLYTFLYGI